MNRVLPTLLVPLLGAVALGAEAPDSVSMSLEEFLQLYEAARTRPPAPTAPPRTHSLAKAAFVGEVRTEDGEPTGAVLDATFRVDVHEGKGFLKVPLLQGDVAVMSATLDGRPAPIVLDGSQYALVTDRKGSFDVVVRLAALVTSTSGDNSFSFGLVPAGATTLDLALPGTEPLDVEVSGAKLVSREAKQGRTHLVAAVPSSGRLAVSWRRDIRRDDAGQAEQPRVYADVHTLVGLGDGLARATTTVRHTILFAGVRALSYDLPDGAVVLDAKGTGLRSWRIDEKGDLAVDLSFAAEGAWNLTVELERPFRPGAVDLPLLVPKGVERTKGYVGVVADGGLEVDAGTPREAVPVDVRSLPAGLSGLTTQPLLLGFKLLGGGASVPLTVRENEQVEVLVTLVDRARATTMYTAHGRRLTRVVWDVRNNRRQFLAASLPEGATLWSASVAGRAVQPSKGADGRVLLPLLRSSSTGTGLTSFPVEVVYVEDGAAATGSARLSASLARVDVPTNYVGWTLYGPAGAKVRGASASGSLRQVDVARMPPAASETMVVGNQVVAAQAAAEGQVDANGLGQGAAPVRVELPLEGPSIAFEKLLVLDEPLTVAFDWSPPR